VKHGRLILAGIGAALVVAGLVFAAVGLTAVGVLAVLVGAVLLVLGLHDWDEFSAEASDLRFRIARHGTPVPSPPRAPEIEILTVKESGGNNKSVQFIVEVANRGTKSCRATIDADVDGWKAICSPVELDLGADDGVHRATVYVSRPAMADLVKAFDNTVTLYGRRLTVRVTATGETVQKSWREHVYTEEENVERAAIQRDVWKTGQDLHPERLEDGVRRTRFCSTCDDVTEQEVTRLVRGGAGTPIQTGWHCRHHGGSPA
jgi:hypothetical protein